MRRLTATVAATVTVRIASAPGLATPRDVVADYFKDGRLDYGYSIGDRRGALVFAQRQQVTGVPWVFPVMAVIAGLLVLAGVGSSVWRGVRR